MRKDGLEKNGQIILSPPTHSASAAGSYSTLTQISRNPGTERYPAPLPDLTTPLHGLIMGGRCYHKCQLKQLLICN